MFSVLRERDKSLTFDDVYWTEKIGNPLVRLDDFSTGFPGYSAISGRMFLFVRVCVRACVRAHVCVCV